MKRNEYKNSKRPAWFTGGFQAAVLLAALFTAVSCNQDPIFFTISQEPAPLDPRIKGAPTSMVEFTCNGQQILYVASGRLHWYAQPRGGGNPAWDLAEHSMPQPGGKIIGLAATSTHLYALSIAGSSVSTSLKRIDSTGTTWEDVKLYPVDTEAAAYPLLQSIHADTERLFAGSRSSSSENYAILYMDGANGLKSLKTGITILSGTVYDGTNHYVSTVGDGIFMVSEAALSTNSSGDLPPLADTNPDGKNNSKFMGIIKMDDNTIVAVERSGLFYTVSPAGIEQVTKTNGEAIKLDYYANGALALWRDNNGTASLLLASQSILYSTTTSAYTHGYMEIDLDSSGAIALHSAPHQPGKVGISLTSVPNNGPYTATLGKHPINHLFQAPYYIDPDRTLFASTQTVGLWSCRERNGEKQWNAEE